MPKRQRYSIPPPSISAMYTPKVWQILNVFSCKKRNHHVTFVFSFDFGSWLAMTFLAFSYANVPLRSLEYETTSMPYGTCPGPMAVSSRLSGCFAIRADAEPRGDFRENGGLLGSNPAVMFWVLIVGNCTPKRTIL